MDTESTKKLEATDIFNYLDIATRFRNHEFNIQLIRSALFTGSQAVFLAAYAATIGKHSLSSLAIACFGFLLSICWFLYYRASLYWAWYWEYRCKQVNDKFLATINLDVDIFEGHPSGSNERHSAPIKFGGNTIKWLPVHKILQISQLLFVILWLTLLIVAGISRCDLSSMV